MNFNTTNSFTARTIEKLANVKLACLMAKLADLSSLTPVQRIAATAFARGMDINDIHKALSSGIGGISMTPDQIWDEIISMPSTAVNDVQSFYTNGPTSPTGKMTASNANNLLGQRHAQRHVDQIANQISDYTQQNTKPGFFKRIFDWFRRPNNPQPQPNNPQPQPNNPQPQPNNPQPGGSSVLQRYNTAGEIRQKTRQQIRQKLPKPPKPPKNPTFGQAFKPLGTWTTNTGKNLWKGFGKLPNWGKAGVGAAVGAAGLAGLHGAAKIYNNMFGNNDKPGLRVSFG